VFRESLTANRAEIIARTRAKVAARAAPRATDEELEHGVPLFLDQLVETLTVSPTPSDAQAIGGSAARHGGDLLKRGFTLAQVVHDYGGVCQAVTELADETKASITAAEFHTFNRCLDDAIAQAVTEYARLRERTIGDEGTERLGFLAHELRNSLATATMAFESLRTGNVGIGGSTSALLGRSLRRLSTLIDASLAHVRLESGTISPERIEVREFVEEVEVGASMEANARQLTLAVTRVETGVAVEADRQLLAAAVANLLQNAYKFCRSGGRVSLKTSSTEDRVLIEVEDECGGLPPGTADELFRPFEQRSSNRTGLGLGLSIARKSIAACGGTIRVQNLPAVGCLFTIDLPRLAPGDNGLLRGPVLS
jgi:signal transduction histidine kinase